MKLIIDIDEYAFERIKEYYDALPEDSTVDAKVCYIANGIPLEQIRDEILNFKEKCNASDYLGCGILDIIDKYK